MFCIKFLIFKNWDCINTICYFPFSYTCSNSCSKNNPLPPQHIVLLVGDKLSFRLCVLIQFPQIILLT